jgi:nucleotide-binding universal stress UspA family protein
MYQKIVVPLDGSKLAECVLPHVQALTKTCEVAHVILVRVVEPVTGLVADYPLPEAQVAKINLDNLSAAETYLADVLKRLELGASHGEAKVLTGAPAASIADFATKEAADVVVIATHGRSGVSRWVWGSVADRILRAACVPVLMVRAPGCAPGF